MILQYAHLHRRPALFKAMTGLLLAEFDALAWDRKRQISVCRKRRVRLLRYPAPIG